jgi:hypothetical protein
MPLDWLNSCIHHVDRRVRVRSRGITLLSGPPPMQSTCHIRADRDLIVRGVIGASRLLLMSSRWSYD